MQDELRLTNTQTPRIDTRVLRHMMHEAIDLLDVSSEHADEACSNTDAAMTLTRIDWMLIAVFNWLTHQLRADGADRHMPLGQPVSVVGIDQHVLSDELRLYAHSVDRLHARVKQLETLIQSKVEKAKESVQEKQPGRVLNIFGDPKPEAMQGNPVRASHQRLKTAFAGL